MNVPVFILAAGASRRLGRAKQLVEVDGRPLIRRQCEIALAADLGPVWVVLGHHADACRAAIQGLAVIALDNPQWSEGLAASLRVAASQAMSMGAEAMLLVHVDQYRLSAPDLSRVVESWRRNPASAHLSRDGDHLGPPAVIPSCFFPAILSLKGDAGARRILDRITEVPLAGAAIDLDEPSDEPGAGL